MSDVFNLIEPAFIPPLDPNFRPAVLANRAFQRAVTESGAGVRLVLGLERVNGSLSRFETTVFPDDHPLAEANLMYAERLVKFLLWQKGGWKVYVGGPRPIGEFIQACYAPDGVRAFDYHFMGDKVYQQPFTVMICRAEDVPPEHEPEKSLGRHLEGCRIGFDLGASDLKISAVVDGQAIFSEEIVWEPRKQTDPGYHYRKIVDALRLAAAKMPRVDAIGGSSAGVYVNNRPMVASLFRGIPDDQFEDVRNMFLRIREEMGGIPLEVMNDGEVTALAGSMSLEDDSILGVAMGSSEAAGYVTPEGNITDWLNELAFAPVDYHPDAPVDEWSGDGGVGALYFSQQAVFRLAPKAGIDIPPHVTDAVKLKTVQAKLEAGHAGAADIWRSRRTWATARALRPFMRLHVPILGRCISSGSVLDGRTRSSEPNFWPRAHQPSIARRKSGQEIP
jgi:predicted NBD/HSP70 family sugar kinase